MTKQLIKLLTNLALALVLCLVSATFLAQDAQCSDCESIDLPGIRKTFLAFEAQCKKQMAGNRMECFSSNIYNKVLPIMKALGKDNRFGPADRIFLVGETQTGNVLPGTERIFQTPAPVDRDQVTVSFNKLLGSGALVKICAVSEDGTMRRAGTIDMEGSEPREGSATLSGMRGKIIRIGIAGRGPVTGKLQFSWSIR